MLIDVLGTVVSVKADNDKRELIQQLFEYGNQVTLGYFLDSADNFKLGDLINGINMIEPFDTVLVALVNRVYPNITGLAMGLGFPPLADGGRS